MVSVTFELAGDWRETSARPTSDVDGWTDELERITAADEAGVVDLAGVEAGAVDLGVVEAGDEEGAIDRAEMDEAILAAEKVANDSESRAYRATEYKSARIPNTSHDILYMSTHLTIAITWT